MGEVDEALDVVHAHDGSGRADQVGEDGGQVAGAGADVEDAGVGAEVGEEGFRGRGVHVRGGDCGAEADGLGRVVIWGGGGVVSAVDLGERCQLVVSVDHEGGWE